MLRYLFAILMAGLLLAGEAQAFTRTTLQNAATATGVGKPTTVDDKGVVGVSVTGTFVGTVQFEGSTDGGVTYSAMPCTAMVTQLSTTTTTTTGQFLCGVAGMSHFQAEITAYTSGAITVVATSSNASNGSGGGGTTFGTANAAAPSLAEGAAATFSFDLAENLRVTLGTLLAGEDQVNNAIATEGAAVRQTVIASGVTTNTTSTAVLVPVGTKEFYGQVVGTGAVTQTQDLYCDIDNDAANGVKIATLTLSGTTRDQAITPPTSIPCAFVYVTTTLTTGTGATGAVYANY